MAHFGRPIQPYAQESTDYLRSRLLQPSRQRVKVQVLRRDQYGRIVSPLALSTSAIRHLMLMRLRGMLQVGIPYIRRWILPDQPLPIEMLKKGMAVVYESAGAEYGPWGVDELKRLEANAK